METGPIAVPRHPGRLRRASFQALRHPLAHEVEVGAFLEDRRDLLEPVTGEGPGHFHAVEPRQRRLDGKVTRSRSPAAPGWAATVLIWTCLLVMSGVTSIGSSVICQDAEARRPPP